MKSPITGSARSVSDFGERARNLFKDRPLSGPPPIQNRFSKNKRPMRAAAPEPAPAPAEAQEQSGEDREAEARTGGEGA